MAPNILDLRNSDISIGLCRKGPFSGSYVASLKPENIYPVGYDRRDMSYFEWWFALEPSIVHADLGSTDDYEEGFLLDLSVLSGEGMGMFRRPVIDLLSSWEIEWAPPEMQAKAGCFFFEGFDGEVQWLWEEESFGGRFFARRPKLTLFRQGYFAESVADVSMLALRTKKVAFSVVRDLVLPGGWNAPMHKEELLQQEPSITEVAAALSVKSLKIAVIPRRFDAGTDVSESSGLTVALGSRAALEKIEVVLADAESRGSNLMPKLVQEAQRRGLAQLGLGALSALLEGSSFCLALLSDNAPSGEISNDPWRDVRCLPNK